MPFEYIVCVLFPDQPREVRARSGAISDAFTRRGTDFALSPMLESPGANISMTAPSHYHIHDYMSGSRGREGGAEGRALFSRDDSLLYEQSRLSRPRERSSDEPKRYSSRQEKAV